MTRTTFLLLMVAFALYLSQPAHSAGGGGWPNWGNGISNNHRAVDETCIRQSNVHQLTPKWKLDVPSDVTAVAHRRRPTAAGSTSPTRNGNTAVPEGQAANSSVAAARGATAYSAVTAANGVFLVGSSTKSLGASNYFALQADTGRILWDYAPGGSAVSGPSVVSGSVYWGCGYARIGRGCKTFYAFSVPSC
ncbi:uncharacterized protein ACA1_088450 [Acanthamoeba castellanii str. Neff]|uniref:Uncharacterized protein n=1 Tax=Acanthamoeba castellanii (strain ATCC 30010 / Neff) TaxID=1257118 RepID=L8GUF3_ACACF|nr:uncharacterized protein ACA1_088450 [Acanthamoeba castellanii str. Neff]ELR16610.1 hypothetical protein ACA1_088450 [Acanthamoeba castellanii str. Neff]